MYIESTQNNQDTPKLGHYPSSEVQETIRLAQQDIVQHILGETIDILLKNGFQPAEIVDAFASQVGLKFENSKATMLVEQASSVLFETTKSNAQ